MIFPFIVDGTCWKAATAAPCCCCCWGTELLCGSTLTLFADTDADVGAEAAEPLTEAAGANALLLWEGIESIWRAGINRLRRKVARD